MPFMSLSILVKQYKVIFSIFILNGIYIIFFSAVCLHLLGILKVKDAGNY